MDSKEVVGHSFILAERFQTLEEVWSRQARKISQFQKEQINFRNVDIGLLIPKKKTLVLQEIVTSGSNITCTASMFNEGTVQEIINFL